MFVSARENRQARRKGDAFILGELNGAGNGSRGWWSSLGCVSGCPFLRISWIYRMLARGDRGFVVVFIAHGTSKKKVGKEERGGCYGFL